MTERPILFSAPMVRALLDGTKTQTRRIVKPEGANHLFQFRGTTAAAGADEPTGSWAWCGSERTVHKHITCRYGKPGDRLWVRETFQGPIMSADEWETHGNDDPGSLPSRFNSPNYCEYAADGGPPPEFMTADDDLVCRWRPSIHMPRWASRILLEVTDVRVERLQDISEADALAEGTPSWADGACAVGNPHGLNARDYYEVLWSSINGRASWDANPWVWCVSFRRITP